MARRWKWQAPAPDQSLTESHVSLSKLERFTVKQSPVSELSVCCWGISGIANPISVQEGAGGEALGVRLPGIWGRGTVCTGPTETLCACLEALSLFPLSVLMMSTSPGFH